MSLMTSFGAGVSALNTAQSALNTTAHNLTNADTKGYVRQQVLITDKSYNKTPTAAGTDQTGLGTIIDKIRQVRDRFLDDSYRREVGRREFYKAQAETVAEIEDLFGELEGTTFQSSMKDLWTAVQELQKEPESIVARTTLVEMAVTFTERCESIVNQFKSYRRDLNLKVRETVDRANEIAHRIDRLNDEIHGYESAGQTANDLRDERHKLLDELGGIGRISYKENSDGRVNINFEGTQFVTEFGVNEIGLAISDDSLKLYTPVWPYDTDIDGNAREVFHFDTLPSTVANTDIGYLKGLLLARGKDQGRYTDIPKEPNPADYESGTEDEGYQRAKFAYDQAKELYEVKIGASVMTKTEAELDQLIHGITTMMNDILSPNLTAIRSEDGTVIWKDGTGKVLKDEEIPEIDLDALEEYMKPERDALGAPTGRTFIRILDTKNAPVSMDSTMVPGHALFERKGERRYTEITDGEKKLLIYNAEDYDPKNEQSKYSLFSMGEIEVNRAVRNNVSLLPLSYAGKTGDFSHEVAAKLNAVWNEKFASLNPAALTKNTFSDYYVAFSSEIANRGEVSRAITKSQGVTTRSVDNQRQQVLGTNSDEELTYLIKFQQSYNAASRYITVIDEMLEHVVSALGRG